MDVFIIDDDETVRRALTAAIECEGHYVESAESLEGGLSRLREEKFDLLIIDMRLGDDSGLELLRKAIERNPSQLVVICTAYASVETAVEATKAGAFDYLQKPFTSNDLRGLLVKAQKALKVNARVARLETTVTELKTEMSRSTPPPVFESQEPKMEAALKTLFRAASTPASILILGESGTGKSVVARNLHERSQLATEPFVTIACPSLSKELLESELFGHVKGSFTGAIRDKWGKVHAAEGGTLFLDEIGELPLEIQPKLLRLLQEEEYERLGENKTRRANVRIIAATNRDLRKQVAEGDFREDLYYRINVIAVELPPLRERRSDLMRFATDYLKYFSRQAGRDLKGFTRAAEDYLMSYPWPGNLRELRNAIERASILCQGPRIDQDDFPRDAAPVIQESGWDEYRFMPGSDLSIAELEEEHIRRVVDRVHNLQEAARILGIDKATLYRKRKRLDLA